MGVCLVPVKGSSDRREEIIVLTPAPLEEAFFSDGAFGLAAAESL